MTSVVEVVLRVAADREEAAVAQLVELSPGGFRHDQIDDGGSEFGVYVAPERADGIVAALAEAGVDIESTEVVPVPDGWEEGWKAFHRPVQVGALWVGPPWQLDEAPPGTRRVVIEPGQGFGTGAHATTHLMLSLLLDQPRGSVLDVGSGSGVLSVAAAVLGFTKVTAIDNDPVAVESTLENLERNGIEGVDVRLLDATASHIPKADIVLANLTLEPLRLLAPRLGTTPRVLASGLLRSQVEAAMFSFGEAGYVLRERRDRDGWVALVLDSTDVDAAGMYHVPTAF